MCATLIIQLFNEFFAVCLVYHSGKLFLISIHIHKFSPFPTTALNDLNNVGLSTDSQYPDASRRFVAISSDSSGGLFPFLVNPKINTRFIAIDFIEDFHTPLVSFMVTIRFVSSTDAYNRGITIVEKTIFVFKFNKNFKFHNKPPLVVRGTLPFIAINRFV